LTDDDRRYLENRNIPANVIDRCRSVVRTDYSPKLYGHKLARPAHVNLPGVWKFGNGLKVPYTGILIAAPDHLGRFVGLRMHDPNAKTTGNPKYRPLKSGWKLPYGENPAATHYPAQTKIEKTIGICEGMEFKAAAAANRLGFPVMGFSGHNAIANSTEQIQAAIDHIGAETIVIIPDANGLTNQWVNNSLTNAIDYWQGQNYTVKVAWWGQTHEGVGDIDEIDGDRPIDLITPEQFQHQKYLLEVIEAQKPLNSLSIEPDILIESGYFPSLAELQQIKPLPLTGILAIVGAKSSGKTTLIKQAIKHYQSLGYKVVSVTPRIALGRGQAFEWEIVWRGDLAEDGLDTKMLIRNTDDVGTCFESIKQFEGRDFTEKTLIILDESELGLTGLTTSSTLKDCRAKTLKVFGDMLTDVLANDGLVICSDADLTNVSIDYVKKFGDNVPLFLLQNNAKPKQWEIEFYTGGMTSTDVEQSLFNALDNGKNYIYCTDSKNQAQAIEREFLDRFPGEVCMNINGDTTQDETVKDWVKNINLAILTNKPRLLIYTGSLGVGASIDGEVRNGDGTVTFHQEIYDHFDAVYGCFFHEQPSQCRQYLARYRKPVKRILWAKEAGFKDESCRSYRPDVIKRNLLKDKEASLKIIDLATELAGGDDADDMALLTALNSMMKDGTWNNPHIDLYCQVKARKNYAVSQLSAQLLHELTEEGHLITVYGNGGKNEISESIKEAKEDIKREESAAIANAPDLDPIELKRLQKKTTHTTEQRAQISKALIKQELPGIALDPDFVFNWIVGDRRKKLNALKLLFYCQHPEVAKALDKKEYRYRLKQFADGVAYLPDIKNLTSQVKVIQDIGFFDLIDPNDGDREYRADDNDVQAFMTRCLMNRYKLNRALGITVTAKSEPMALMERIGKKVDITFKSRQYRTGGDRQRVYSLDLESTPKIDREKILNSLAKKHAEIIKPEGFEGVTELFGGYNTPQESSVTDIPAKIDPSEVSTVPQHNHGFKHGDRVSYPGRCPETFQLIRPIAEVVAFDGYWVVLSNGRKAMPHHLRPA
jgi:hypothetical protein